MSSDLEPPDDVFSDVTRWIGIGCAILAILSWSLVLYLWKFGLPGFIERLLLHR
jgi:hypothetical protein